MTRARTILLAGVLVATAFTARAGEPEDPFMAGFEDEDAEIAPPAPAASLAEARRAYRSHCATCHGVKGRGDGSTAAWLDTPPRDFTVANYKWRTTPTGALPTDEDLLRTVDEGALGTSMPGWRDRLPEPIRRGLVEVLKSFSPRFAHEPVPAPLEIPPPPEPTPELLERGRRIYEEKKCGDCHGSRGLGDGPAAGDQKDSQGRPMAVYDFTKGFYKAGDEPEVVYRTLMTGLNGTPMPSYALTTTAEERWPLVLYTVSLHRERGVLDYLFTPIPEQQR